MAEVSRSSHSSLVDVAGAGFRLSLVLNAVGVEVARNDLEIQSIARAITSFSLILKQVGLSLEDGRSIASTNAVESARDIAAQSQTVFDEIKGMVEMVQKQDEAGHIQSIAIAQRVKWCFKKQRVHYLLGQLEVLKLSLSLMLQILQMGRLIADSRENPSRPHIHRRHMLQDRAEIQNMVVVRYWSLIDLSRLYDLADHETSPVHPSFPEIDRIEHPGGDARLSIEPAPRDNLDDQSKALVKYQETPLTQLNEKMNKALTKSDHLLQSPKDDVVDLLLDEWTRLRHIHARHLPRRRRYGPHYETDTSDLSSSDFHGAKREKGYYLENGGKPNGTHKNIKNVRFRARVESDDSDSDGARGVPPGKKHSHRYVLHSDESITSDESDTSDSDSPPPRSRRSSDSTTTAVNTAANSKYHRPTNARGGDVERPRRPYTSGDGARPVSRGSTASPIPQQQQAQSGQQQYPPYQPTRGMTLPNPNHGQWSGGVVPVPGSPNLRPPSQGGYYPPPPQQQQQQRQVPQRATSYGVSPKQQHIPNTIPSSPHLAPYNHRSLHPHHYNPVDPNPLRQNPSYRRPSAEDSARQQYLAEKEARRARRRERERQKEIAKARKKAGLDEKGEGGIKDKAKKGLIGAGAVAGLLDILQGLDGL